jgi:hypothetical protein
MSSFFPLSFVMVVEVGAKLSETASGARPSGAKANVVDQQTKTTKSRKKRKHPSN